MPKSEKFLAPAIVGKAEKERKPYLFRNKQNPGTNVSCFTGRCPIKGKEWFKDTVTEHNLVDGQIVHLTDDEREHFEQRGIEKELITEGNDGHRHPTGQKYIDNRFTLNPV